MNTRPLLSPRSVRSILSLALAFGLSGCTSREEKILGIEEEMATIIDGDKDDCEKMARDLTHLNETKGEEARKLKHDLAPTPSEQKELDARMKAKFGPRVAALEEKVKRGAKCLLTSPAVVTAMMALQGDGEDQPGRAPPAKPFTGAPVAFVVEKIVGGSLDVSAYNFGDKTLASYDLLVRYHAADGSVLKSPDSRDFVRWSIAGLAYRVPPKQWRRFEVGSLEAPSGAASAEILVDEVRALDGDRTETAATWKYKEGFTSTWPSPSDK